MILLEKWFEYKKHFIYNFLYLTFVKMTDYYFYLDNE